MGDGRTTVLIVVAFYLVAMIAIGLSVRGRVRSTTDFLVAGRRLGLVLITATLAAVQLGAGVILGGAELAAEFGVWPGVWAGIGAGGGLIITGWLVATRLRRHGGVVPLDFFAHRYGEHKWVRLWAWFSNIPSLLGILVAQLMAAGAVLAIFGVPFGQGVAIAGAVVVIYSAAGGMWGAAVTDLIQLAIIVIGVPLVAIVGLGHADASVPVVLDDLLSTPFVPDGMGPKMIFVILPFLLSISVSYDAYMRIQAAKSEGIAKWGAIAGGGLVLVISLCAALLGAMGRDLFPSIPHAEVLPRMIETMLTPAAAGLVVSALLAAAMSTANTLVVSLAGCFCRDLYNKVLHPEAELDELPRAKALSRAVVVGSVALATLVALQAKGILGTMILFNYPYMSSMLVPLLGGVLWAGATPRGAFAAMLAGGVIGVGGFVVGLAGAFEVDLGLLLAYAVSSIVFVGVSLADRAHGPKKEVAT